MRSGGRAMSRIADALHVYGQMKELVATRRPVVFLDFDGTLSDITAHPDSATLVHGADEAVRALAAQCPVAVVSGRDPADVRERVKVDGVWYAGSHGMELIAPDGTHHEIVAAGGVTDTLAHAARRLAETLNDVPGIAVEHKGFALAVHYRNADSKDVNRVIVAARELARSEGLRVTPGRKVIELRPSIDGDKGTILNWLLQHIRGRRWRRPGCRVAGLHRRRHHRRRCLRRGPVRRRGNRGAPRRAWRSPFRGTVLSRKPLCGSRIRPSPGQRSGAGSKARAMRGNLSTRATTRNMSGCAKRCARSATATSPPVVARRRRQHPRRITRAPMPPACTTLWPTGSPAGPSRTKASSTCPTGWR